MSWLREHAWVRRSIQWAIVIVALGYVLHSLVSNWQALHQYDWRFDALRLLAALGTSVLARCLLAGASQQAFSALGFSLTARAIFRGYHISGLSAYLPGGLYVGRPLVFADQGVDPVATSVGVLIEESTLTLSGMVTAVPYVLLSGVNLLSRFRALWLAAIPLMILLLWPSFANRMLRWLLDRVGYKNRRVHITASQVATMLMLGICSWMLHGVGFWLLVTSVCTVPSSMFPVLASANSLAGVLSTVVALTPAGLGVHESAVTLLLSPLLAAPLPAVLAILTRLLGTLTRALLWGLATFLMPEHEHSTERSDGRL